MSITQTRPTTDRLLRAYNQAPDYRVEPRFGSETAFDVTKRDGTVYVVDGDTCSCPDHAARGRVCKHIHLCRLHRDTARMIDERPAVETTAAREARVRRERVLLWG
jgi:hypothetical protein